MNLNRSRAAVAGAISAAFLVGMPMVTAASAGAVQDPGQMLSDPPPGGGGTPPGAEDDGVVTLEILDPPDTQPTVQDALDPGAPPSKEDLEEPALVVESTVNDVAEPVSEPQQALDLVRDDERSDEQSGRDSDEPDSDEPGSEDPTADGPAQGEAPAGEDANRNAPTGDLDNAQAGQNQNPGEDTKADAAAAPEAARTTSVESGRTEVTGEAAERSSAMALDGATIGGVVPDAGMPVTGAATVGLLQTGLGLIGLGALLVAGTGRHRRVRETRRTQDIALII